MEQFADIAWLDQPEVFRVNQLPARSDHVFFADRRSMEAGDRTLYCSLNGEWRFQWSKNAALRPAEFYRTDFDDSGFGRITVPGHMELAGYDRIHYINNLYPWEGHVYRRPAFSAEGIGAQEGSFSRAEYNPVGSYVREFDLPENLLGKRVCICFEGAEQAMYVWLNGAFVGYAEDSFSPSEFDLTPYIKEKGNRLAVEVHKRSTAAYLEDQDFFRFSGLFRDVYIYGKPELHLEDLWVRPILHTDNCTGDLELELRLSAADACRGELRWRLEDGETCMAEGRETVAEQVKITCAGLKGLTPWEYGQPKLYRLEIGLQNEQGETAELVPCDIGFRRIAIENGIICLNGKRLILNGVNRHEWSPERGRAISREEMDTDLRLIRENNINAVRTCHYPDQPYWYTLCDRAGIYLMAETNLESHGSWQKLGQVEPSWNVPGSCPAWLGAVMDRARSNFAWFKNHPSVLFWSLGNESYAGDCIKEMNRFFKETDPLRLVHYEGVFHNRKYEDVISDVESRMYAAPAEVAEYLEKHPKKPFILCEYMHSMGNSVGGMDAYMELLDRFPQYQGGFIWDFCDQALWREDCLTGGRVLCYGGDFDDRPSDCEFSGNGIFFANREPKPALQEVRYLYGKYC